MHASAHDSDAPGHPGSAGLHHATDDHGDEHGHDDHAHAEEPLGPIDIAAWGAGILGLAIGVVMALCFLLAVSPVALGI